MFRRHQREIWFVTIWGIVGTVGLGLLAAHSFGGVTPAAESISWPTASQLPPPLQRHLYVFAHPKCPCTKATLAELSQRLRGSETPTTIVFVLHDDAWIDTPTVAQARQIEGANIVFDVGGVETSNFPMVEVSGHCCLFDATGTLRFSGGITVSRGHEGANAGLASLLQQLRDDAPGSCLTYPVYGCRLQARAQPSSTDNLN